MYNNKERADEVDFWEQHNGNMTEEEKQEIRLDHLDDEDKQNEQDFNILGMSHKEFGIYAVKMGEDWRKNHPELMDAYNALIKQCMMTCLNFFFPRMSVGGIILL